MNCGYHDDDDDDGDGDDDCDDDDHDDNDGYLFNNRWRNFRVQDAR